MYYDVRYVHVSFFSFLFCYLCDSIFVFFFKQKTAYEMRISDWSSDVCSSDLRFFLAVREVVLEAIGAAHQRHLGDARHASAANLRQALGDALTGAADRKSVV